MVGRGMRGGRGHAWWRAVCDRGVSVAEMATKSGGTHPTGMHSCCFLLRLIVLTTTLLSFTSKRRRYQLFCADLFVSKYCYVTIYSYCLKFFCYNTVASTKSSIFSCHYKKPVSLRQVRIKAAHSGFETQRRRHQKSKTGVSIPL